MLSMETYVTGTRELLSQAVKTATVPLVIILLLVLTISLTVEGIMFLDQQL